LSVARRQEVYLAEAWQKAEGRRQEARRQEARLRLRLRLRKPINL
jgi:hypothetical protein